MNSILAQKVDAVESQCVVLRQAIGTMADAVADEIDDLKRDLQSEVESRLSNIANRVQNSQLSSDKVENEQIKLRFQLDRLSEDM